MQQHCQHCNTVFEAKRRDKKYCSASCKQMDYIQRNRNTNNAVVKNNSASFRSRFAEVKTSTNKIVEQLNQNTEHQNVNVQELERTISECAGIENNVAAVEKQLAKEQVLKNLQQNNHFFNQTHTEKNKNVNPNNEKIKPTNKKYVYTTCKWMEELYYSYSKSKNITFLKQLTLSVYESDQQTVWISKLYRSLLSIIIRFSNLQNVKQENLIHLSNAFTLLIQTAVFKNLRSDYPYKQSIEKLKECLKQICLETQNEEVVDFSLSFTTKKGLLLELMELKSVCDKMSFKELMLELKNKNKEGGYVKGAFKRGLWRKRFRKTKIK